MRFLLFGLCLFLSMIMFSVSSGVLGLLDTPDAFGIAYMVIFVFGILGSIVTYFASTNYLIWSLNLNPLNIDEDDKLDEIYHHIKRLALSSNIRPPELYFFQSDKPNVIMIGTNPDKTVLAFSDSMLKSFNVSEIAGSIAPLITGATNNTLRTKTMLIALMATFGLCIGQFLSDKIKKGGSLFLSEIVYKIFFILSLLIFNLPTYIILRLYTRKSLLKNDVEAMSITSSQEIISGLSRVGTKDCMISPISSYISLVGEQKEKDNILNPFSTIPNRIECLMKEKDKKIVAK